MLSQCALSLSKETELPKHLSLAVPFLCQAPYGNWQEPWQDACEEASLVMAATYFQERGERKISAEQGKKEILSLVVYQVKQYGGHYDLTAEQIAKLARDYFHLSANVESDATVKKIKQALARGQVVIVPAAGRLLGNPYYTPPGPAYHNLLIKGYDDDHQQFISNDCGTKRGESYRFDYQKLFNAIHDWPGDKHKMLEGKKVLIVIGR